MALIQCSDCSREISSRAKFCPHCGCPLDEDPTPAVAAFIPPGAPPTRPTEVPIANTQQNATTPQTLPPRLWLTSPVSPWRRFGARFFDNSLYAILVFGALGAIVGSVEGPDQSSEFFASPAFTNPLFANMVALVVAIIPSSLVLGLTGTSLGKWLFSLRVVDGQGAPIGIKRALTREFTIFVSGLGFGIPIVSLVTMINARSALLKSGHTSWDNDPQLSVVMYRKYDLITVIKIIVGTVLVIALILVSSILSKLGGMT